MAGKIPQQFIDDLLSRIDIVDVIEADLPLKKAGKDFQALCPFHGEKTPSFTISQEKQFYHCFGCGAHGSALGFVMNHRGLNFVEAVEDLAHSVGMQLPERDEKFTNTPDYTPLYSALEKTQTFFTQQLRNHPQKDRVVDYLKSRGLTGQIAKRFGIGYAPESWDALMTELAKANVDIKSMLDAGLIINKDGNRNYDRFRDRIMFPIHDRRGRVVAFGGRVIDKGEPKYLNSPETPVFQKRRELYGLYQIRQANPKTERILVVEGYMDVVALAQFGVDNAVATLGTATSTEQLEILFKATTEVVFCYDGDKAGMRAATRAMETVLPMIKNGRQAGFLFLPDGHDPDSFVREFGGEAFNDSARHKPLSEFLFDHVAEQTNLDTLDGRARFVELTKPLLEKIPNGPFREMMQTRSAEIGKIDPSHVISKAAPAAAPERTKPRRPSGQNRARQSNVRQALKRILLLPGLAQDCVDISLLRHSAEPGVPLLCEIIDQAKASPNINTGTLLEQYRGGQYERALAELLDTPLELDDTSEGVTFHAAIEKLIAKERQINEWQTTKSKFQQKTDTPGTAENQ